MAKTRGPNAGKNGGSKKCPPGCKCGRHNNKKRNGKTMEDVDGNEIVIQTRTEVKQAEFLQALRHFGGIIQPALDHVGISRTTYRDWYNKYPRFKELVDDVGHEQKDFVRSKLMEGIKAGSERLIEFYLSRRDPAFAVQGQNDGRDELPIPTVKFLPANDK
jgi:hypothetical protein